MDTLKESRLAFIRALRSQSIRGFPAVIHEMLYVHCNYDRRNAHGTCQNLPDAACLHVS